MACEAGRGIQVLRAVRFDDLAGERAAGGLRRGVPGDDAQAHPHGRAARGLRVRLDFVGHE
jgi:hypothetical protein